MGKRCRPALGAGSVGWFSQGVSTPLQSKCCWKSGCGEEVQLAGIAESVPSLVKSKLKTFSVPEGISALKLEGLPRGEKVLAQGKQHEVEPQNSF